MKPIPALIVIAQNSDDGRVMDVTLSIRMSFENDSGYKPEEVVGSTLHELLHVPELIAPKLSVALSARPLNKLTTPTDPSQLGMFSFIDEEEIVEEDEDWNEEEETYFEGRINEDDEMSW